MVDTSTLAGVLRASQPASRPRRTQMRETEPPVEPRRNALLNAMGAGMLRNQQAQIQANTEGVGTGLANVLVGNKVVPDSALLQVGALAGDIALDPMNFVPGLGLVVGGLGNAGKLSAIVRKLNKSNSVEDFITPETMRYAARPNNAHEGLFRPGVKSFDYDNVPQPASPYTFDLVPTERLAPLREFDRMAEPAGQKVFGPDNVNKLADHLASGGKLSDPLAVGWDPKFKWGYLAEGNHRLAAAQALGLEQLPTTVWRMPGAYKHLIDRYTQPPAGVLTPPHGGPPLRFDYGKTLPSVGRRMEIDTNQLMRDSFGEFPRSVGDYYVPPKMHPLLLKYFQQ